MKAWRNYAAILVAASSLTLPCVLSAQQRQIDTQKSVLTIQVGKRGLFSGLVHNHEIAAPITSGSVNTSDHPSVELRIDSKNLTVRDPGASDKERGDVQETMLGLKVLDSQHYPEIAFGSSAAEAAGAGHWVVRGELTLHGQKRPVTVDVMQQGERYTGHATVKQTDFGIQPVRVGTVTVKDEVLVEFDIQLVP